MKHSLLVRYRRPQLFSKIQINPGMPSMMQRARIAAELVCGMENSSFIGHRARQVQVLERLISPL